MKTGDRVAWSHQVYMHHPESVIYADAAPAGSVFGTITGVANTEGTWFEVALDDDRAMVLTADELVRIADEAPAPAEGTED
jgi:hypothetical protein